MAIKILQIDLQNDITPQIGSYDNAGGVTPNNWNDDDGVYSLGPTNGDGRTPYYWFTPTREVTDFDLCWEDYQSRQQTTTQYHLEIGDSAGNVVLSALRQYANYYIGPTSVGNLAYQTWHKILIEVRKASTSSSTVTVYVDGKKVATGTSGTLLTSAKIALLGHVPNTGYMQNAGQRLRYVTIYDRSYASKGINLDGMMTTITALISKFIAKLSTVALTGSYNDLSDKPTISTVNNGTLTIQKNGTNVATFTANQSTNATANIAVPVNTSDLVNDSGYLTASSNLDASKLTSGTVDIARLPQGALERLVKVANEAARYALTTADVQLGDTVQQLDTGIMYIVTDADHLDSAAGYTEYTAGTAASVPWSGVTGKPTFAAVATSGAYSDLTGTPTIPTVNNATLTIQQNGTTIDTFTANSSTDKTVNISVPTNTSELTNGAGFITADYAVPRSGGAVITGTGLYKANASSSIFIGGGDERNHGGNILLIGASAGWEPGTVILGPNLNGQECQMYLKSSGTWIWNGQPIQYISDQRLKQQISEIDDKLLDAWEDVNLVQFKYNDAVDEKGDNARLHTGYVVQQIDSACKEHGVDVSAYGLYCHEEYPQETEEVEVEQADGTKTKERKVIREASEHYSLRYTEVYAVECKYLRRCIARLTARIEQLEKEREASK